MIKFKTCFLSLVLALVSFNAFATTNTCMRFPTGTPVNCVDTSGGGEGAGNVGIGTINFVPQYIGVSTLGPSNIVNVAGNVGINNTAPADSFEVNASTGGGTANGVASGPGGIDSNTVTNVQLNNTIADTAFAPKTYTNVGGVGFQNSNYPYTAQTFVGTFPGGAYLTTPYTTDMDTGTGPFTKLFYVYYTSYTGQPGAFGVINGGSYIQEQRAASNSTYIDANFGSFTFTYSLPLNEWHQVAYIRGWAGDNTKLAEVIDNVQVDTVKTISGAAASPGGNTFQIGTAGGGTQTMNGYIAGFKFDKVARCTASPCSFPLLVPFTSTASTPAWTLASAGTTIGQYQGRSLDNSSVLLNSSGGVNIKMLSNGNVGVGSSAPGNALDVNGTVRAGGITFGSSVANTFSSTSPTILMTSGSLPTNDLLMANSSGTAIDSAVSFGTITNGKTCTATSSSQISCTTTAGGATPGGGINAVQYNNPIGTLAGTENIFSFNGTNVGIGTTNGTHLLDIWGTVSIAGIDSNGNVGIGTPMTTSNPFSVRASLVPAITVGPSGGVGIGTSACAVGVCIGTSGATTINSAGSTVTSSQFIGAKFTGTGAANGVASIFNGGQSAGTLAIVEGNISTLTGNGLDAVQIKGGNVGIGTWIDTFQNGNVGIGTVSPVNTLDVRSTVTPFFSLESDMNGNIGISTSAPQYPLHIWQNSSGVPNAFVVQNRNGSAASGVSFLLINSSANNATNVGGQMKSVRTNSGANGGSWLSLSTSKATTVTEGFRLDENLNVGIGTTGPMAALDVEGTMPSTFYGKTGFGNNVGIGSFSAGATLDVQGTIRFTGGLLNTKSTTGIGWSEHNATNQACNTTCGTSACVIGLDIGTVGVVNSGFVACTDATADDCICAGP